MVTWYHFFSFAFIFQIAGGASSPSVVVTGIFLRSIITVRGGEGGLRAVRSQRSVLKEHSISQVMEVL